MTGSGTPNPDGITPQIIATEPPFAGNPNFTIGLTDAPAGAAAALSVVFANGGDVFFTGETTVAASESGEGFASLVLEIPDDRALVGRLLLAHWTVTRNGTTAISPDAEFVIFAPGAATADRPANLLISFPAASLRHGQVAPGSIVSGFGVNLAAGVETAVSPLPNQVGGVQIRITDSHGAIHWAPVYFVSPQQINYLVPEAAAKGEAQVTVLREGVEAARGTVQIDSIAPTLFAANSNGLDTAAALLIRVTPEGMQFAENIAEFNAEHQAFLSKPLILEAASGDTYVLSLYGAGIRNAVPSMVSATIGGLPVQVLFAGAQPEFDGLDQVNLLVPPELAGQLEADVVLTIAGRRTNIVRVRFGS